MSHHTPTDEEMTVTVLSENGDYVTLTNGHGVTFDIPAPREGNEDDRKVWNAGRLRQTEGKFIYDTSLPNKDHTKPDWVIVTADDGERVVMMLLPERVFDPITKRWSVYWHAHRWGWDEFPSAAASREYVRWAQAGGGHPTLGKWAEVQIPARRKAAVDAANLLYEMVTGRRA